MVSKDPNNRKARLIADPKSLPDKGALDSGFHETQSNTPLATIIRSLMVILETTMKSYATHTASTVMPCSLLRRERTEQATTDTNHKAEGKADILRTASC